MAQRIRKDDIVKIIAGANKGTTGNAAQNILINQGFKHAFNLSGGMKQYSMVRTISKKP